MAAVESEDKLAADTLVMGQGLLLADFFFIFSPALFPSRAAGAADSGVVSDTPAAPTWSVEHRSSAALEAVAEDCGEAVAEDLGKRALASAMMWLHSLVLNALSAAICASNSPVSSTCSAGFGRSLRWRLQRRW